MNLAKVMDELAAVAGKVEGLHCYAWPTDEATPPAAWPVYPVEIGMETAMARGTDRWRGGLWVVTGRVWDRSTRDILSGYTAGDGPESIAAKFFEHDWQSCAYARPVRWTFDALQISGIDLMGALLELDIAGPGATGG